MFVGIIDIRMNLSQLNVVEFLWDLVKCIFVFIQVYCISIEFILWKYGGEKGVFFRIQVDIFKQNENGEYIDYLYLVSC